MAGAGAADGPRPDRGPAGTGRAPRGLRRWVVEQPPAGTHTHANRHCHLHAHSDSHTHGLARCQLDANLNGCGDANRHSNGQANEDADAYADALIHRVLKETREAHAAEARNGDED